MLMEGNWQSPMPSWQQTSLVSFPPAEKCLETHPATDLPGFQSRLRQDDHLTIRTKAECFEEAGKGFFEPVVHHCQGDFTDTGINGGSLPCHPSSTTALQTLGESQASIYEERFHSRSTSPSTSQNEDRLAVVGNNPHFLQWSPSTDPLLGHNNRGRCLQPGVGGQLSGVIHGVPWTSEEQLHRINFLELKAAFLALKPFCARQQSISVLLRLDNITAINFLNRMGGTHSVILSDLASQVWDWCIKRNILIHAEHLLGVENIRVDWESRHIKDANNWKLNRQVFLELEEMLGPDMFASRMNTQLQTYCSWRADPAALAVDGLSIPWKEHYPFMFPPFALISRYLDKLCREEVSVLLIAPVWPNQTWFPQISASLSEYSVLIPPLAEIRSEQPNRPMPPVGSRRLITSSRLACVREINHARGHSERVIIIIQKSWRSSTKSAYSNAWRQWNHWCLERSSDPLSAPLDEDLEFLEFLCEQFDAGNIIH